MEEKEREREEMESSQHRQEAAEQSNSEPTEAWSPLSPCWAHTLPRSTHHFVHGPFCPVRTRAQAQVTPSSHRQNVFFSGKGWAWVGMSASDSTSSAEKREPFTLRLTSGRTYGPVRMPFPLLRPHPLFPWPERHSGQDCISFITVSGLMAGTDSQGSPTAELSCLPK